MLLLPVRNDRLVHWQEYQWLGVEIDSNLRESWAWYQAWLGAK